MATDLITQKHLKSLLRYDRYTGEFRWRIKRSNRALKGSVAGCADKYGYIVIRIDGTLYKAHRLAWLYEYGVFPAKNIDHINQNPDDNRIANLREVDQHQNNQNRRVQRNSRSGITGVSWNTPHGRWQARIWVRGQCIGLGMHETKEAATLARAVAERELYPFRITYADADI
jgi:hypothetical protein